MRISEIEKSINWTVGSTGLTATKVNTSVYDGLRASEGFSSGKWYWEGKHISDGGTASGFGVVLSSVDMKITYGNNIVTTGTNHKYYFRSGVIYNPTTNGNSAIVNGDVIGIALDLDDPSGVVQWYKNGVKQPQSFTGLKSLGATWYPAFMAFNDSSIEFRFTEKAYSYPIPEGYRQAERLNKFLISSEDGSYYSALFSSDNTVTEKINATNSVGVVSSSNVYGSSYDWYCFDQSSPTSGAGAIGWLSNGMTNQWIAYKFPVAKSISKYTITCVYDVTKTSPKDFRFEGSNDGGVTWVTLDTQTNQTSWVALEKKTFYVPKTNISPYKMYRIFVVANNGSTNYVAIGEIEMMENWAKLMHLESNTENAFINYGMDKESIIDLTREVTTKGYTAKDTTTLGGGKVFKHKIDASKTPIKKASIT